MGIASAADRGAGGLRAGKLREAGGEARLGLLERGIGGGGGGVNNDEDVARRFGDHAARGIADGAAEGAVGIGKNGAAFKVPGLLADAFVAFAGRAVAERNGGADAGAVVAAVGPGLLDGAEVADVHHIGNAVESFTLDDAAEKRFRRRAVFRWVEAPCPEHGADETDVLLLGERFEGEFAALAVANFVHHGGEGEIYEDHVDAVGFEDAELRVRQFDLNFHLRSSQIKNPQEQLQGTDAAAMKPAEKKEKLELGMAHFNAEKFFEAHEVWEEVWLAEADPEKTFLQGLIQVAAAFHHYKRGNSRGAESLLMAGILKLSRCPEKHFGMAIGELRGAAKEWARLLGEGRGPCGAKLPRLKAAP